MIDFCFFFFKQKTAYEIQYGLVGSEMCIRDRGNSGRGSQEHRGGCYAIVQVAPFGLGGGTGDQGCLLYTSDAADERSSVDLGGRRIIKKKTTLHTVVAGGV